ncbi:MAG: PASTA domain-containing protein [Ferruginibacter sp.]
MPNLIGMTLNEAKKALHDINLEIGALIYFSDPQDPDSSFVVKQNPPAINEKGDQNYIEKKQVVDLWLVSSGSYRLNFLYPSIKSNGQSILAFVPAGWKILDSAYGDMNKDGLQDAAIILQHKDSVSLVNSLEDTVLTQPRILLLLFKNPTDHKYRLAEQSNSFILKHDNSIIDDSYQGIAIDKGILKIDFHIFHNRGSWYTTSSTYKFRYDGSKFTLIGADLLTIHRATLDYEEYSYNFLIKKRSYTKGNEEKGTKKTTVKSFPLPFLKTFKTFKEPYSWEIEAGINL